MAADVALDPGLRASLYPFCRLTGPANVLVMPGLHAAHILTKVGAAADQRDGDRPAADRPDAFGADRADAGGREPDAGRGVPGGPCGGDAAAMAAPVCTIGYEGATPDALIATLRAAGVRVLVDVRALANSRRPGFAKTRAVGGAGGGGDRLPAPARARHAGGRAGGGARRQAGRDAAHLRRASGRRRGAGGAGEPVRPGAAAARLPAVPGGRSGDSATARWWPRRSACRVQHLHPGAISPAGSR